MRKVFFTILILFAYAIILGHNLIPHTHHSHHQEAKNNHDHHQTDHHHHDHDDQQDDKKSEESGLPDLFAHFIHAPYTVNIEHTLVFANEIKELKNVQFDAIIAEAPLKIEVVLTYRKLLLDVRHQFYSSLSARNLSLRAPPVC
jgi:hypothetical protein